MAIHEGTAGSGTYAVDEYRASKGIEAANALTSGRCHNTVSGDHLNANELCVEVIARLSHFDSMKAVGSASGVDFVKVDAGNRAADNLKNGLGTHKKQADHSGGNTCAQVIQAAIS